MSKTNWKLDPSHSEVTFKVKHMMITNVTGGFGDFNVAAVTDGDDFSKADITFTAKASSINTNSEQRDNHLRSAEFFDAEKFPEILFKGSDIKKVNDENFVLTGELNIRGSSKSISLNVEFGGIQKDPYGQIKAGFTVTGKFNRKDFGLNWNATLEAGGVMVSEEVRVNCEIQLIKA